jgi:hypothetical protein
MRYLVTLSLCLMLGGGRGNDETKKANANERKFMDRARRNGCFF